MAQLQVVTDDTVAVAEDAVACGARHIEVAVACFDKVARDGERYPRCVCAMVVAERFERAM